MLAFKLLSVFSCAMAGIGVACAQSQDITNDSRPSGKQISAWLNSGDSRYIAWGAYFARETADDSVTPGMVRLLERWQTGDPNSESAARSRLGISYVMDTLISRNQQVTSRAVIAVRSSFPTEAIILLAKMPEQCPANRSSPSYFAAAVAFYRVHACVGCSDNCVDCGVLRRACCQADACTCAQFQGIAHQKSGACQFLMYGCRQHQCIGRSSVRHQDHEFVAAIAKAHVLFAAQLL